MTSSQTCSCCQALQSGSNQHSLRHLLVHRHNHKTQEAVNYLIGFASTFLKRPDRFAGIALGITTVALGMLVPYAPAMADGASLGKGLSATPLVLKDGRIARVSIHTIPFPKDASALASTTMNELEAFTQTMATDCFLTAQVIGHAGKAETDGRDTVDIHRLARARADTIQDKLIANGLPAASIASVWDWQFMVQDARATLWVFQLAAGDDCENDPLLPASSGEVAAVDDAVVPKLVEQQEVGVPSVPTQPVQQRVVAATKTTAPEVTKPIPASLPKKEADKAKIVRAAVAPAAKAPDAVELAVATTEDHAVDKKGRVVVSNDGVLEITFATNSSYMPQGSGAQLQTFLDRLDQGESYIVQVQTSIDGETKVAGTSSEDEAIRYNRWLAERRFERVKTWLLKNSKGNTLKIEPTEVTNDGSRRVTVQLNPLS